MKYKFYQLSSGLFISLLGVSAYFWLLYGILSGSIAQGLSPLVVIMITLCSLIFADAGLVVLKGNKQLHKEKLSQTPETFWGRFGSFLFKVELLKSILGIILISALLAGLGYLFFQGFSAGYLTHFDGKFWAFLGGTAVYFLLLRKQLARIIAKIERGLPTSSLATFTFGEKTLTIDLNLHNTQDQSKKYVIEIPFEEIDEIEKLSWTEAEYYLKFKVGPDFNLAATKTQDLIQYLQGAISRPQNYVMLGGTNADHLLLKGKNLFYLVAYKDSDFDRLQKKIG